MEGKGGTVLLEAGEASATIALTGAEPRSWRIGGRELLWHGDPAHWDRSAPILFPVVGASAGGMIRVDGKPYPMPQHGFARDSLFEVVEHRRDAVRLRLSDSTATRAHYPFAFALEVTLTLGPAALALAFEVRNTGGQPLPYALGVHPAFPWPFEAPTPDGHAVVFAAPERPDVPLLTADGLLRRQTRRLDVDETCLPLTSHLFAQGALVFLDAASAAVDFVAPSGARITLAADGFPHLALWTKPTAPFLSMEAWTGHADWEDAGGELAARASMRSLPPGAAARHVARMTYTPLPARVDATAQRGQKPRMRVDLFDFDLPEDRIALRPASPREAARLLVVRPGGEPAMEDRSVGDLPGLLRPGDALVLNDTKVIPARLFGVRVRDGAGARMEIMLHSREGPERWRAFARPAKKLAVGDRIRFGEAAESIACELVRLDAEVEEKGEAGEVVLRFSFAGAYLDEAIARLGEIPLPPYIAGKRPADDRDQADYQTVYAREEGAVAAPTAGLHFTDALFRELEARGVSRHFVTLHVGAGTFLPVKAQDTADHRMHAEWGTVDADTADALNAVRGRGGRIVAVGTTSLRLLESAAREDGSLAPFSGETAIFITPGHRFRAVDALMTNFHLPRSTLFMLVAAFSGLETMRAAYAHAVAGGYRFYSYGDSSLLFPEKRSS